MKSKHLLLIYSLLGLLILAVGLPKIAQVGQAAPTVYNIIDYGAKSDDKQFDNGEVINQIIQKMGKSGGKIYIPTGNFYLKTPIVIDRSYISLVGDGSGLRSGIDEGNDKSQADGGGSRLIAGSGISAIQIMDKDNPQRITGLRFADFQLHGLENNGVGIEGLQDTDGVLVDNVVIKNIGTGIYLKGADAPTIQNSWIAETKSSIVLAGASQQAKIVQNALGAQPTGVTIEMENAQWFTISGNTIFPDGASNIRLYNPLEGTIASNTITSYYVGMIEFLPNQAGQIGSGNTIAANTIALKKWKTSPDQKKADWGLLHLETDATLVSSNVIKTEEGVDNLASIRIASGKNNKMTANHLVGGGQIVADNQTDQLIQE